MIRVRHRDGTVTEVQDGLFVEVCDTEGKPAAVVFMDSEREVRVAEAGSWMFTRYLDLFGETPSTITKLRKPN